MRVIDKVSLVVNRVSGQGELTFAEIENTAGLPVYSCGGDLREAAVAQAGGWRTEICGATFG